MMDDITHTIADAQYGMALKNRNATIKPLSKMGIPSQAEYEEFSQNLKFDLDFTLDSPIALFFLEEFGGE